MVATAAALAANYLLGPLPVWRWVPGGERIGTAAHRVDEHDRITERALELVPADAVVSASNSVGAHLSERRRILSFPLRRDADWVVVDATRPGNFDSIKPRPYAQSIRELERDARFRMVFAEDGVLVFVRSERSGGAGRR
jgi:hypothetical protein